MVESVSTSTLYSVMFIPKFQLQVRIIVTKLGTETQSTTVRTWRELSLSLPIVGTQLIDQKWFVAT